DAIGAVDNSGIPAALGQSSMPAGWASQIAGPFGGNDTIQFDPGLFGAARQTITLGGTELMLSRSASIAGPGADRLAVSGNHQSRVFDVTSAATVNIAGLTVADGSVITSNSVSVGGGILNFGTLTLSATIVAGNLGHHGGGVYNAGTLTVTDSLLSGNTAYIAGSTGGGIFNAGTLTVTSSTLSGNSAA